MDRALGRAAGIIGMALIAGCAGGKAADRGTLPGGIGQAEQASELERRIAEQADGSQPGRIVSLTEDELVLQPYDPRADTARLSVRVPTPVFRPNEEPATYPGESIAAGTAANVYFVQRPGEPPRVLGIRVLSPDEARTIEQQLSRAGAPSGQQGPSADELFAGADGSQTGEIDEIDEGVIVLDPYDGEEQALVIYREDLIVLRDGRTLGFEALSEGDDVRVFYKLDGSQARAIGVEVLSHEEAERQEEAAEPWWDR